MRLILPIPNSELATNKSKGWHWSKHSALRKKQRLDGYYLAMEYCSKHGFSNDPALWKGSWCLKITTYYTTNKHLDDDNLLSGLKSFRDGVFDFLKQTCNMNDKQITLTILDTVGRNKTNPHVIWELMPRHF